jgi:predicted TIM-barrel fold metal-dependent hydrolase
VALPPGSCDCQFHVYGDRQRYPVRHSNPLYEAPDAPLSLATAMHDRLGFGRVVLVQATVYTTDHNLLLDCLNQLTEKRARGVAIIDDSVSDEELQRLHRAGVRAARFNFQKRLGLVPSFEVFHRSVARIKDLGWFIKIFAGPAEMETVAPEIARCDLPVVLDHMGHLDFGRGVEQPAMKQILAMLERDVLWIMLSNGHRGSAAGYPWDDAVAFGRAFYAAAPDRCIWGSDWPHIGSRGGPMPDDADLLALLMRYLPDEAAIRKVLVDNPARLFGFSPRL